MGRRAGTVWVLGAGFSRPLGGPLLQQLFSKASRNTVRLRYPKDKYPKLHGKAVDAAHWLYHWGTAFAEGPLLVGDERKGERLWSHAEQFLDMLDAAAQGVAGDPNWERLCRPIPEQYREQYREDHKAADLREVVAGARRLLAAECSGFLLGTNPKEERWQPYVRWASEVVQPADTIITFNYDLVLEKLHQEMKRGFAVATTKEGTSATDVPLVLKLHGSVNWKRVAGASDAVCSIAAEDFALNCPDEELAIASPGPSKLARARELGDLWDAAATALSVAKAVVFVGYRFPPTDAEARGRLLEALATPRNAYVAVHTVLGPESQDTKRLHKLLAWTLRKNREEFTDRPRPTTASAETHNFTLDDHELYAEDFFSICNAGIVEQAYRWKT